MRFLPYLIFGLIYQSSFAQIIHSQNFTIGETLEFHSEILHETRQLNIYLPDGFNPDSANMYQVIYLLDGSRNEDFIHIAGLVQFATFPWIKMIPPTIVVGIGNVDRKRDLTFPTTIEKDKKDFPTTGGSARFIEFIEKELKPLVLSKYKPGGPSTIIGQSLGGLLATEILFKKPDLFDHYIIISPSLWWDRESLLKFDPVLPKTAKKVFVGVGKEGKIMQHDAKALSRKLKSRKSAYSSVKFDYFPKQNHGDVLHLAVYKALEEWFD